jgi:AraC family transcriptional regulator of adaptative response / DNA-3-methyladenine glycosylase II
MKYQHALMSENCQLFNPKSGILLPMELNHEQCYAAIQSRDERFDGRFFTGVKTTGIYCRPVCPATTPRSENVTFYTTAAAAAAAGFRPCLRCRPESSPGTPEWQGGSAVVSRALRLISDGVMDEGGVDTLAQRLHLGSRQLRRLFNQHLGVSPVTVGQTRRLHFAKKLIDETDLPMTEIAFTAGYSSIRRYNDAIQEVYGRTPTELRKNVEESPIPKKAPITLKLAYRPPFNWPAMLNFLAVRATPGVEWIEQDSYYRTITFGQESGIISVKPVPNRNYLLLSVPLNLSRFLFPTAERIRRLFDLQADPVQICNHLCGDPLLAAAEKTEFRLPGTWDGFEIALRAILGQQVTVRAATTLMGRLVERGGTPLPESELPHLPTQLTHLFPTPEQVAAADLTGLGTTRQRIAAVQTLANAVLEGALSFTTPTTLEEAIETLTALPGIGRWTAHYIAMRGLSEPDAFPAGDLILRRAAAPSPGKPLTEKQLLKTAEAWRPWRAYAAILLWQKAANE